VMCTYVCSCVRVLDCSVCAFWQSIQAPKRSLTAYMIYSNRVRPDLMKENPEMKITEVSKHIAERWKVGHGGRDGGGIDRDVDGRASRRHLCTVLCFYVLFRLAEGISSGVHIDVVLVCRFCVLLPAHQSDARQLSSSGPVHM